MTAPKIIRVTVPGTPQGQPRARAFARRMGDKFVARVYDPGTAEGWKSVIAEAFRPHLPPEPWEGKVMLSITAHFKRPASHFGSGRNAGVLKASAPAEYVKKPDADNIAKAVMDCLTRLGLWRDDSQVDLAIGRAWGATNTTEIRVERIEETGATT